MNIEKIEKSLMRTIKRMLKLTLYTNTKRLKFSLGIPDIQIPLYERLVKLKEKYLNTFGEECTIYNNVLEKIDKENSTPCKIDINLINVSKELGIKVVGDHTVFWYNVYMFQQNSVKNMIVK